MPWVARTAAAACALCAAIVPALALAQTPPSEPEPTETASRPRVGAVPILRVAPGAGIYVGSTGAAPAFVFDVAAGAQVLFGNWENYTWDLAAEASYTFSSHPRLGGHLAGLGVGPLVHVSKKAGIVVGWAPKVVFGVTHEAGAVGMRNMAVVHIFDGALQVEVGHQWLRVGGDRDQHEARVLVGIDPFRTIINLAYHPPGRY